MMKRMNLNQQIKISRIQAIWGVIIIVAAAGVAASVLDYKEWHSLETKRFGQGVADLTTAAKPLTWEYKDTNLGVQLILPGEWLGQDVKKYISLRKGYGTEADQKVWLEEVPGGRVIVHQRLAKNMGGQRVVMESAFAEEEWGEWENTIKAIFDSMKQI